MGGKVRSSAARAGADAVGDGGEGMNKYHARKTEIDGIAFDSQAEARRYQELIMLVRAGEITGLAVHPRYVLLDPFVYQGKRVRGIEYEPDFVYRERGATIAEDVKGGHNVTATRTFEIKAKLFRHRYPDIILRIVEA